MEKIDRHIITIDEPDFNQLLELKENQSIVVFWMANSALALFQGEVLLKIKEKIEDQIDFYQIPMTFNSRKQFIFIQQLPSILFIKEGAIQDILNGIQSEAAIVKRLEELGFINQKD